MKPVYQAVCLWAYGTTSQVSISDFRIGKLIDFLLGGIQENDHNKSSSHI